MAMTLPGEEDDVVSAINTTPLVDVMLVLLIIFLITIPVVTNTVAVELPKETNQPRVTAPENINIAVTRDGKVFWNESAVTDSEALVERLKGIALQEPQPEVQIRGDGEAPYEFVGKVIFACQRAGIVKVGFITEPPPRG
ncbi:ExbD/TolR family protein [Azoarcus olearius]|uniref:Biopolymer transport protein ExbD n=1 Tax=Azoarcus sp. (strain BH72) TaxID=418699 RepID=A1K7Z3_AZOSB|nr:biopolymer transporter ExbD [Azoarcus olearius]ANQ85491.1 putative biopolymer transport protein ExbD [Azoarcus olearius]CAL94948.1 putative biopolymer transport protein ExbD [Azoarcus olearius]